MRTFVTVWPYKLRTVKARAGAPDGGAPAAAEEETMLWCTTSLAIVLALSGLAALTVRLRRPRLPRPRPVRMLRGCLALLCMTVALGFLALALVVAR